MFYPKSDRVVCFVIYTPFHYVFLGVTRPLHICNSFAHGIIKIWEDRKGANEAFLVKNIQNCSYFLLPFHRNVIYIFWLIICCPNVYIETFCFMLQWNWSFTMVSFVVFCIFISTRFSFTSAQCFKYNTG